jgi:hypothetical protein
MATGVSALLIEQQLDNLATIALRLRERAPACLVPAVDGGRVGGFGPPPRMVGRP